MWTDSEHVIKPKTKRGEFTLGKIFRAATELFYEKGYFGTSIIDITERAGISNGTFYIYFKDKYSLFCYTMQYVSRDLRRATTLAAAKGKNRYEKELSGFKGYLDYMLRHPGVLRIIFESLYVDPALFKAYYENFSKRYSDALRRAIADGEVLDCDVTVASYLLIGSYTFVGIKHVVFDEKKSISDEEAEKLFNILEKGLFNKTEGTP